MTALFLRAFFKRPTNLIRQRYGDDAYIDMTGDVITIADQFGTLGEGATLREAMAKADAAFVTRFPLCANCDRERVSDPDDRFCHGCAPFVRAINQ